MKINSRSGGLSLSCSNESKNTETKVAQTAQLKGHLVFYAMPG